MPRHLKRRACSHCGCYLPASGVRVRLRRGQVTATCLRCGEQTRHPYRERTQEPSKPRVSPSSIS
jgi:RNase P subunit RPR2